MKQKDILYPLRVIHGKLYERHLTRNNKITIDKLPFKKRAELAMDLYEKTCGYRFDLENPVTFTEKITWYKLYYDNPNLKRIVDKFLFKDYIREQLGDGYTLPLYGSYQSVLELREDWANLPDEFMLKSNLQSDGNCIKHINKNTIDLEKLLIEVNGWLNIENTLVNSCCRGYYGTTPRIIAEEYKTEIDDQLYDYKFWCFGGEPYCVYAVTDHFPGQISHISFYDLSWNRIDVLYGKHPHADVKRPKHFEEMLELSRKLSVEFPFVRVDFFNTNEKLYMAEMTFYPGGGLFQFDPPSFNKTLGDLFVLPK